MALVVPATGITLATVVSSNKSAPAPRVAIARPVKLQLMPVANGAVLGASTDAASSPNVPTSTVQRTNVVRTTTVVRAVAETHQITPVETPITASPAPRLPSGTVYNPGLDLPTSEQISEAIKSGGPVNEIKDLGQLIDGPIKLKPTCVATYPTRLASAPLSTITDSWGMPNRESVSYAAYRVHQNFICGKNKHDMPTDWNVLKLGAAIYWPQHAIDSELKVDTVATSGAIRIDAMIKPSGFAMYVEQVNADGSVMVSDYDRVSTGLYSVQTLRASSSAIYIHFD